jgi:plasmid stabilization system protein ParE
MHRKKYRISRKTDADIERICDYVAKNNPDAADRLDEQIHRAIQLIGRFPGLGHTRPDVQDKRHLFRALGNYVIAHRLEKKELVVVRVVHGARDFRKLFPPKE